MLVLKIKVAVQFGAQWAPLIPHKKIQKIRKGEAGSQKCCINYLSNYNSAKDETCSALWCAISALECVQKITKNEKSGGLVLKNVLFNI